MRSNLKFWQELQESDYFESHPCYKGLVDMGDSEVRVIGEFLPLDKSMKVVVIGCGYGREAAHIAPQVNMLYGIDVSPKILSKAQKYLQDKSITNFTGILAETYRDAIPPGIDLVFSIVVMQHLTRDLVREYFQGLGGKLSEKGRFIIQFLEDLNPLQLDAELKTYEPSVSWSLPDIVKLCSDAGLRLDEAHSHLATDAALWHWICAKPAQSSETV